MSEAKDPRILFAAERTLLAWNRTSLALIAFGFLVERAGLLVEALAFEALNPAAMAITFFLGIAFILVGAFSALYSSRQYSRFIATLDLPSGLNVRWGMVINVLVALLGLGLVVAISLAR